MDRTELIKQVRKFKKQIQKAHNIQKLIIFGSQARGEAKRGSDIDIVVIGNFTKKKNRHRAPPFHMAWTLDMPVDFLCYTPAEIREKRKEVGIVQQALDEGISI